MIQVTSAINTVNTSAAALPTPNPIEFHDPPNVLYKNFTTVISAQFRPPVVEFPPERISGSAITCSEPISFIVKR